MGFFLSGLTIKVDVEIGGAGTGMRFIALDMSTPIDERTTTMRFLFGRNFLTRAFADKNHLKRNLKNVREDRAIAEAQMPRVLPKVPEANLLMTEPEDRVAKEYWAIFGRLRAKGWQIDREALGAAAQLGGYPVIPSPARRANPNDWVHGVVPLVDRYS